MLTGCKGIRDSLSAYNPLEPYTETVKWTLGNPVEFITREITAVAQKSGLFPPMRVNLNGEPGKERTDKRTGAVRDLCINDNGYG